jgi:hypothetical protein
MTEKLREELISTYPKTFAGNWKYNTPSKLEMVYNSILFWLQLRYPYFRKFKHRNSKNPYDFKFYCKLGWFELIRQVLLDIKEFDTKNGVVTHIYKIEQRYGVLKIYIVQKSKEVLEILKKAEETSKGMCEYTGSRSNIGAWYFDKITTMSKSYALDHYNILVDSGKLPYGVKFEDCWKPQQASKTIVINKKG